MMRNFATVAAAALGITTPTFAQTEGRPGSFGSSSTGFDNTVHRHFGLAGHFSFSTNQDPSPNGGSYTLNTWALGAVFSATYN